MNLIIAVLYPCLSSSEKGLNGDSNPDLCDADAVLHQMSYQANWEQVVMWVDYNPVDVEIDNYNTVLPLLSDAHEISWLNHDSRMTTSGDNSSQLMFNSQITAVSHVFPIHALYFGQFTDHAKPHPDSV